MRARWLALLAVLASGCGLRGTVATTPTAEEVQRVRVAAVRIADGVTIAVTAATDVGRLVDQLPIPTAAKDGYDCAVIRVVGASDPSAVVTRVCGTVPTPETAPLPVALAALQASTTCPSLRSTVMIVSAAIRPLLAQVAASDQPVLRMAASTLTLALAMLESGGIACSL